MKYQWSKLNKQQVGSYCEYFVKMELTMYGFQVYSTEVDDRGIDFVTRYENEPFITIQVKGIREKGYVFLQKDKFKICEYSYLALAVLNEKCEPSLYLIPSRVWEEPNGVFVSRDYENKKSKPEWGINLSSKNMHSLKPYLFSESIKKLIKA